MLSVVLSRVSFAYGGSVEVLHKVSVQLEAGWTGVVGDNGAGKTTLLRLISGEIAPGEGDVELLPAGARAHVCEQRVDDLTPSIAQFSESWCRRAMRLRDELDLDDGDLVRWSTLSPGERKRWQIAAALLAEPDVLLLDEPTNHIDAAARGLLQAALHRYAGIGVIVSHDRSLLDELTTSTVRISGGTVRAYRGGYSLAAGQWRDEERAARSAHASARAHQRALVRRLADERRQQAAAQSRISARSRIKSAKDSDARSVAARGRAMNAEARLSRKVRVVRGAVERATARVEQHTVVRSRGRSLFVDFEPPPASILMHLERDAIAIDTTAILRAVNVTVHRDTRVHLAGDNGAGKTTLMTSLLAANPDRAARFLHLPQEMTGRESRALIEEVATGRRAWADRVYSVVAALGADPMRIMRSVSPSPGELRKLKIATGMASNAWALFLDEPTNHLDLAAIERLEGALEDYPGALVLITHDRDLAGAVTSETWEVRDGTVMVR